VLAKVTVALQPSLLSCRKARKPRIFTLVRESYGATSWFGWKLDETIGAKILSVPIAVPLKVARDTYLILIAVFAIILLILNLLLHYLVITPMKRDWQWDAVSRGDQDVEGLHQVGQGRDLIALGIVQPHA
jgi:protein-histidine pros-kinase